MPELPEIEIVKRSLLKIANKAKIIAVQVYNRNLRYKLSSTFSRNLINQKILNFTRRSKYLIFHFKKKVLLVHLGMSGKLLIKKSLSNTMLRTSFYYDLNIIPKHNHIFFKLNNNVIIIYNDIRRFGFFKIYEKIKFKEIKFLRKLGLEPLYKEFNVKYFKKFSMNKKKNIKNLLMDQTFVSGLGNIYVNEALYMSKINPLRRCDDLNDDELKNLLLNIKKILKISISKGGASIKDFQNTSGKKGKFQEFFYVYGKENKRCSRIWCKGLIKKISISNRSTFYCNKCQQ